MSSIAQSLLTVLTADALLTAAFVYLYHQDRVPYLRLWAWGWAAVELRHGLAFLAAIGVGPTLPLLVGIEVVTPVSLLLIVAGTLGFFGRRLHPLWIVGAALAAAWATACQIAGASLLVTRLPSFWLLGLATAWAGSIFLRRVGPSAGARVTGLALVFLGLHLLDHPFLRDVSWFAPWGFWLASLAGIVAALGILVLHFDRTRARLAESEARYRSLYENALEGIFVTTAEWRLTEGNPAFLRLLGAAGSGVAEGLDVRTALFADEVELRRLDERLERDDAATFAEVAWRRLDGAPLRVSLDLRRVRDGAGRVTHLQGLVRDVTERRRLEEALRQAQKMEALGRVAGGVAHDFNNLLTVILGSADLLDRRLAGDDPQRPVVDRIAGAAERAAALTGQLLAFSRRQVLRPAVVDLGASVQRGAEMLRRLIGEDVTLSLELAPTPLPIRADPVQLEQVLLNLAINARDAMPDGGTLTLRVLVDLPGRRACLEVEDTGEGMDLATLEHVFEPFYTTKGPGQGTGLGLAMVYGIVTQSGGDIAVESHPGRGSIFRVKLPLADGAAEGLPEAPAAATPEATPAAARETVLVAEDDEAVRRLVQDVLEGAGYRVLAAGTGEAALALAADHAGPVDLLVSDVVMPGMRGPELAARLAEARPGVPVVLMSGYADRDLRIGAETPVFLAKPFTPGALLEGVATVLGGSRRTSPLAAGAYSWSHGDGEIPEDG